MGSLGLTAIHLRDPFVLLDQGRYYLYGTRGATVWTEADGFDCYTSGDLVKWDGPHEIFRRSADFWADRCYWAPECIERDGAYFLVATFGAAEGRLAVQVLKADSPLGPFVSWSGGPVTPADWACLDGTFYVGAAGGTSLLFSRSFRDAPDGDMYAVELTPDLTAARGDPRLLFSAAAAPWVRPFPHAAEFGVQGDVYLADGPTLYRAQSGQQQLLWSSFGSAGYTVGVSRSASGELWGPWVHDPEPLFAGDGGHCMLFRTKEGKLMMALHAPNTIGMERPTFIELAESDNGLSLGATTQGSKGG